MLLKVPLANLRFFKNSSQLVKLRTNSALGLFEFFPKSQSVFFIVFSLRYDFLGPFLFLQIMLDINALNIFSVFAHNTFLIFTNYSQLIRFSYDQFLITQADFVASKNGNSGCIRSSKLKLYFFFTVCYLTLPKKNLLRI